MSSVSSTSSSSTTATTSSTSSSSAAAPKKSSYSLDRSGLTVSDVVDAKVQPYLDQISALDSQIANNQVKISAYQSMQTLLLNLESAVNELRNPDTATDNIFNARAASMSSSDSNVTASSVLSASIASGTAPGTHTVVVSQVATAERLAGSVNVASPSTALGLASGTLTLGEVGGSSVPSAINITSSMTLNDVVAAVNNLTSTTGVTAQVLTVASGEYKLMLTGADTDQSISLSDSQGGSILNSLGLASTGVAAASTSNLGISAGSFTLGTTGGTGGTTSGVVNIGAGASLNQIVQDINSANTGVTASLNGDQLQLTAANGGTINTTGATSGSSTLLSDLGLSGVTAAASGSVLGTSIAAAASASLGLATSSGTSTFTLNSTYDNALGFAAGTLTLGTGTASGNVSITAGMSANQIVAAINAQTYMTNVGATLVGGSIQLASDDGTNVTASGTGSLAANLGLSGVTAAASTSVTGTAIAGVSAGTTITVSDSDSLTSIAAQINAASGTGCTATVQNGALLLAPSGNSAITVQNNALTQALGISGAGAVLQQAQAANLTVDGVAVTRSSNNISDVLDGITLNLNKASAGTTVTLAIKADTGTIESAIGMFVTLYNQWKNFVAAETATTSDGTAASSATLFGDSTLRSADLEVDNAITALVGTTSLGALGITLDSNNNLQVDSGTLENELTTNLSTVQSLFEYQASAINTATNQPVAGLSLLSRGDCTFSGTLSMNVTTDATGAITSLVVHNAAGVDISNEFSPNGTTIKGNYGTPYSDLLLNYAGSSIANMKVTVSQGIADQLFQTTSNLAGNTGLKGTVSGSLPNLISSIQQQDTNLTTQAGTISNYANTYRSYLLDMYGQYESTISNAEQQASMMQMLMAYDTKS